VEQASSEDRLAATLRTRDEGIASILASDSFAQYLSVMSRFHHYSFGNIMLVLAQRPEATQVAGYRSWQRLGRQVRKGEQGIRILVPHRRVVELEEGEETTVVRSFGIGSVFDITQTDGNPLPKPLAAREIREVTDAGAALYGALEAYVTAHGITVVREELTRGYGYYAPARRQIGIDSRITSDQATKTLAHETAHAVADHRAGIARVDAETVAESAAYVVLSRYGIDSSDYSFPYVARWAEDRDVLTRNLAAIQQTSHAIISGIEERD
jgi:antirestriction protein ArdC